MQPAARDSSTDRALPQAGLAQLPERDHTVLAGRQASHDPVGWGTKPLTMRGKVPHPAKDATEAVPPGRNATVSEHP